MHACMVTVRLIKHSFLAVKCWHAAPFGLSKGCDELMMTHVLQLRGLGSRQCNRPLLCIVHDVTNFEELRTFRGVLYGITETHMLQHGGLLNDDKNHAATTDKRYSSCCLFVCQRNCLFGRCLCAMQRGWTSAQ